MPILGRWDADDNADGGLHRYCPTSSSSSGDEDMESSSCNKSEKILGAYYSNVSSCKESETILEHNNLIPDQLRCSSSEENSDVDSESSLSYSSSEDDAAQGLSNVDLTYERVVSLQRAPRKMPTTYAKGGASVKRMRAALEKPICTCGCRVPLKLLVRLCTAFWSLAKGVQDSLLWSLQHESGKRGKRQWFLQGLATWEKNITCFHLRQVDEPMNIDNNISCFHLYHISNI